MKHLTTFKIVTSLLCVSLNAVANKVDLALPNNSHYALLNSIEVARDEGEIDTTTSYAVYLDETVDVEKDDVLVVRAVIEGTHQPLTSGDASVADFRAYLSCDNRRISPYRVKSLKRYYGNHHGSMVASGFCHYTESVPGQINVNLKAKSTRANGLIHFKQQTKMYIDHFRAVNPNVTNLDSYYFATEKKKADIPMEDRTIRNLSDSPSPSTYYDWQTLDMDLSNENWTFINAQGTVDDPNIEIPLSGFSIVSEVEKTTQVDPVVNQLSLATENPTRSQLYRISQYGYGVYKSENYQASNVLNVKIKTRMHGKDDGHQLDVNMQARRFHARLEGLVFRKGVGLGSYFLTKIFLEYPPTDVNVYPNNTPVSVGRDHNGQDLAVTFNGNSGLMRIKLHSTLEYVGTDVRSCYARIVIHKGYTPIGDYIEPSYSTVSGRYLKSPYKNHNLSAEYIFEVDSAGTYQVKPYVYCGNRNNQVPVKVENTGTWTFIEKFE